MSNALHRMRDKCRRIEADNARNDVCRAYEQSNKSSFAWADAEAEFELLIREIYPLEAADKPMER